MSKKPSFFRIVLACLACLTLMLACSLFTGTKDEPTPPQPASEKSPEPPIVRPTNTPRPTIPPEPTSTPEPQIPCDYKWDQITTSMVGTKVCVYGVIYELNQSNRTSTRYQFSDEPNTFFMFSQNYIYTDPNTGKTLGPGTCISIEGEIELYQSIPYIDMEKSDGLYFYSSSSLCD